MTQNLVELTNGINSEVEAQISARYKPSASIGDQWIATGAMGGRTIYPQGKSNDGTGGLYYQSFKSFDVLVDGGDEDTAASLTDVPLTNYLASLYSNMSYGLSADQKETQANNAQEQQKDIKNWFSSTWISQFGPNTNYYDWAATTAKDAQGSFPSVSQPAWYANQAAGTDINNISAATMLKWIDSSWTWCVGNAMDDQYKATALQKDYQDSTLADITNAMYPNGTASFSDVFTGNLLAGAPMSWNSDMYTWYVNMKSLTQPSGQFADNITYQNGIKDHAQKLLQWYTGNTSQQTKNLNANKDQYSAVYTDGNKSSNIVKYYVPVVDSWGQTPSNVASWIDGDNPSTSWQINIDQSSGGEVKTSGSDQKESSYSINASASYWFFQASSSASGSKGKTTSFNTLDSNSQTASANINFKNTGIQTWSPRQSGVGAWFLLDTIESAYGAQVAADGKSTTLPWVDSPNFRGGWGFSTKAAAIEAVQKGFSYVKSLAYSGAPTTTVTTSEAENSSSVFSESNFEKSAYSASAGVGFSGWYGNYSASASTSGSSDQWDDSTTSKYDSSKKGYTITNNGIGKINDPASEWDGYGALEMAVAVAQPAWGKPASQAKLKEMTDNSYSGKFASAAGPAAYKVKGPMYGMGKDLTGKHVQFNNKSNLIYSAANSNAKDIVSGMNGHDTMLGGKGNDKMYGGKGNDFISGGYGKNYLVGGKGKDWFELDGDEMRGKKKYQQIIGDYETGKDQLWFTNDCNPELVSYKGKNLMYDGEKVAKMLGLSNDEMQMAVDSAGYA